MNLDDDEDSIHPIIITSHNSIINSHNLSATVIRLKIVEKIGIAMINPRGIAKGRKDITIT